MSCVGGLRQWGVGCCFSSSLLFDMKYFGVSHAICFGNSRALRLRSVSGSFMCIYHTFILVYIHVHSWFLYFLAYLFSFLDLSFEVVFIHAVDKNQFMFFLLFFILFLCFFNVQSICLWIPGIIEEISLRSSILYLQITHFYFESGLAVDFEDIFNKILSCMKFVKIFLLE